MCSLQIIASKIYIYINTYGNNFTGARASGIIIDRLLRHCCFVWSEMIEPHSSGNFNFSFNLYVYIHLYSQKGFITQYQTKTKLKFNLFCQSLRTTIEKCTPFIPCRTIIFGISGQVKLQGHPTDLFLTISVLQRKFCWLGTEVLAVLLGSKFLNLRSRIYQMYQKFLLEVFYPSNFARNSLCARIVRAESRADDLFTADHKICTWAPLLEIRNQATLCHLITLTGITRNLAVFPRSFFITIVVVVILG